MVNKPLRLIAADRRTNMLRLFRDLCRQLGVYSIEMQVCQQFFNQMCYFLVHIKNPDTREALLRNCIEEAKKFLAKFPLKMPF